MTPTPLSTAMQEAAQMPSEYELLTDWADAACVHFVSRSHGQATTSTVSRDDLLQLIRAVLALHRPVEQAEKGWRPIETAPKDGTPILLANQAGVSEGGWLTDIDHGADWEGQLGAAGWWRTDGTDWPPTHWMPLPSPPIDSTKGESNHE